MNEMHMVFCYSSPNRLRQSPFTFQSIPPNQLIKVIKVTTMLLNPVASSQHPSETRPHSPPWESTTQSRSVQHAAFSHSSTPKSLHFPAQSQHTAVYKTDKQQGPTAEHRELCSVLSDNLHGKKKSENEYIYVCV